MIPSRGTRAKSGLFVETAGIICSVTTIVVNPFENLVYCISKARGRKVTLNIL